MTDDRERLDASRFVWPIFACDNSGRANDNVIPIGRAASRFKAEQDEFAIRVYDPVANVHETVVSEWYVVHPGQGRLFDAHVLNDQEDWLRWLGLTDR